MLVYILFSALNRQVKLCTVFCDVTVHSVLSNLWVFFVLCHTMKEKNATFVSNSFLVCIASCPFDFCTFLCDPTAVALLCQTFFFISSSHFKCSCLVLLAGCTWIGTVISIACRIVPTSKINVRIYR